MKEGNVPKGAGATYACFGFILGIGIFSFVAFGEEILFLWLALIALAALAAVRRLAGPRIIQISLIILAGIAIGGWRYEISRFQLSEGHISAFNGQASRFRAIVVKEPEYKPESQRLVVKTIEREGRPVFGRVQISSWPYPRFHYGDTLEINCELEAPENREFAYDRYLARYDIYSLCFRPHIRFVESDSANPVFGWLLHIKARAYAIAERYLPSPESGLALPIVFGGTGGLDEELQEEFRRTGLTHIMAVSGFNVSLLAVIIGYGLFVVGLSRRWVFILTSLIIVAYVAVVGAPASAVRAGILSILILFSLTVGRLAHLGRTVMLVAVATLIYNPKLLRDDIGWQLSFLAVYGLIYLHPLIKKWLLKLTANRGGFIIDMFAATMAAQIATTPVTIYNFGQVSLIAPLANILVVWIIPVMTITVIIAIILTALIPSLGLFFSSRPGG